MSTAHNRGSRRFRETRGWTVRGRSGTCRSPVHIAACHPARVSRVCAGATIIGFVTLTRSRTALVAAVLISASTLASCGSDDPAVCSSVDALQSSVANLKDTPLDKNGLSALESSLEQVGADAKQVRTDAGQQYESQVTAFTSSVSTLEASVEAAKAAPSAATLKPVATAVAGVGSEISALKQAVSDTC